jgi:hypothetical protein
MVKRRILWGSGFFGWRIVEKPGMTRAAIPPVHPWE